MSSPAPFDESDLDRVLAFFDKHQPEEARFARSLIDRGSPVIEAWGPEQMAVYHLAIRYGTWEIMLHTERGYRESLMIAHRIAPPDPTSSDLRPFGLAILAWARSHGAPFRLDGPTDFDHDLAVYGLDTLDWLESGNEAALERLHRVSVEGPRPWRGPSESQEEYRRRMAEMTARLEEAAR